MKAEDVKKVVCIGAGTIGASWATYFLWKGLDVSIQDRNEEALDRAKDLIHSNLQFLEEKGVVSTDVRREAEARAVYTVDLQEALDGAQYVQESAFESYDVKQEIVRELDRYAPGVIYATSTSGLLISEIQKTSKYPERCITAHPFNPPHLIPLVEIVKGKETSEEIVSLAYDFFKSIDKEPIILNIEVPGHVASRIQLALWRECADLVLNGVCSVKDVDLATRYGPGLRWALMGPHLIWDLAHPKGIEGILEHIGPSMDMWLPDMANWEKIPDKAGDVLREGLKEETANTTADELKQTRDDQLIELLKIVEKI
jgi:3-hydroxyacyl-CoA dehydrogenase